MNNRTMAAFNALSKALGDAGLMVPLHVRQRAAEAALTAADKHVPVGTPLICSDERHTAKIAALEAALAAADAPSAPTDDGCLHPLTGLYVDSDSGDLWCRTCAAILAVFEEGDGYPDQSWALPCPVPSCGAPAFQACRRYDGRVSAVSHGQRWARYDAALRCWRARRG